MARGFDRRLDARARATVAIAGERSLPLLLQGIVDNAREVTGARYGALGVAGVAGDAGALVQFITSGMDDETRQRIGALPRGHGLLGVILHETRPVRLARMVDHPLSHGFPPHHPPMTSFLGVPILLHGTNLGNLYLTEKQGAPGFSQADEELVVVLAAHAAIAIDNAHRYERSNEAQAQRLGDLAVANEQLQRLTSLVITAQEEERQRISRELHDDTAQALTALLVRMRLLSRQAANDEVRDGLLELLEITGAVLQGVRRLAIDLRPSTLDDLGLVPAVESYARAFGERCGIAVRTRVRGFDRRLPSDRELMVYRVVQEALTNVANHAAARQVEIDFASDGARLKVCVRDDGQGFVLARGADGGLGLLGMRERAQLAGGFLTVESAPGAGTTVTLIVPSTTERPEGGWP